MFPPWSREIWQRLAQALARRTNAFATSTGIAQDGGKALASDARGLFCDDCYPSPYPWPGPLWVRSSLFRGRAAKRRIADLVGRHSFGFHLAPNAVESRSIKTIIRGSVTCGNRPYLSWRFARPPFQRAWTTTSNAAEQGPLAALCLARRLALIRLLARLSAALVAWCATTWAFANKPHFAGLRHGTANQSIKTTRASSPGGFLLVRAVTRGPSEGRQCSKRY